ncbi:MAG: pyridoxal 5-phosphate synthase pdxT subunit [Frankiaceae bacterium]|nr:pyridoxal 5-phosphate synthase pdxT subunit [Frankiaceae bacterium]MDQ1672187.1 pyridoxal 5-phosphate synthase pdxT subunit [Frankiaceae bacterium]
MTRRPRVGVLALQGDVREHIAALSASGADAVPVRRPEQLDEIDGIVLPGGESTTIGLLLRVFDLLDPLRDAVAGGLPTYGSCAGMILLAREVTNGQPGQPLIGGLDASVERNAFGRQVNSFEADLDFAGDAPSAQPGPLHAVFIRAPAVEKAGSAVEVLAAVDHAGQQRPVAVRNGHVLATSFHPELTSDRRVHDLFVSMVRYSE